VRECFCEAWLNGAHRFFHFADRALHPVGIPAEVTLLRGERQLRRFVVPGEYPNIE
jgi:hypothetical protein